MLFCSKLCDLLRVRRWNLLENYPGSASLYPLKRLRSGGQDASNVLRLYILPVADIATFFNMIKVIELLFCTNACSNCKQVTEKPFLLDLLLNMLLASLKTRVYQ